MARRWLRRTVSLIFLMAAVIGTEPPYAQRHDADELAPLRGQVSQLYKEGNYIEAIPLAERSPLHASAMARATWSSRLPFPG